MRGSLRFGCGADPGIRQGPESAFWESDGRDIDSGCGI